MCITSGDLIMAQTYIDEAQLAMKEIRCVPGCNYTLYNLALLRYISFVPAFSSITAKKN